MNRHLPGRVRYHADLPDDETRTDGRVAGRRGPIETLHRWDTGPGTGQRAGSWLSALTFGSEMGKWLLILAVVLGLGMPLLAMLGIS